MRPCSFAAALGLIASAAFAAPDDWRRPPEPGEAGIMKVLGKLREIGPDGRGYSIYLSQLPYTTRPEDLPVLLRELPKGPTEPLIEEIARYWSSDPVARTQRSADPSPLVRRAVVRAIVQVDKPTAADYAPLADRLVFDDDADVRRDAALAAEGRGGVAFAKLLAERIDQAPPTRLADVVRMLAEQGTKSPADFRVPSVPADGPTVAAKLEQLLAHADPAVRAAAVSRAPPGRAPWPSPVAARLADDPDPRVRLSLAESLRGRSAGASPTGLKLLDDQDGAVRGASLDALLRSPTVQSEMLRPPEIVAKLAEMASDPDPFVRGRLKIWPMFRNARAAAPGLIKALNGERSSRLAALEAMAWGLPQEVRPAIEKLLDDADAVVRARAFAAAGNFSLDGALAMRLAKATLEDANPSVRHAAQLALARVFGEDHAPVLDQAGAVTSFVRRTPEVKIASDRMAAEPRAFALVQAYDGRQDIEKLLDLLAGDDAAGVDAVANFVRPSSPKEWERLPALATGASARGGRAAAMLGIIIPGATRREHGAGDTPDEANPLTRAIRKTLAGGGRDASLARLALRETPAAAATAGTALLKDAVPTVRVAAVSAVRPLKRDDALPRGVLAALDDPDPMVAGQAAAVLTGVLSVSRGDGPPPPEPEPAATRLRAADATVRAAVIAESAEAAKGSPVFAHTWYQLMSDPDPAVRTSVAAAFRRAYAERPRAQNR